MEEFQMNQNKNMLKDNNRVEVMHSSKKNYYAVIEVKVKVKVEGKVDEYTMVTKSYLESYFGIHVVAKNELYRVAKKMGGKVTYFNAFS